jgi:hypothetical protein
LDILAAKRDFASLATVAIARRGELLDAVGKQSDLTPLLRLAEGPARIADLAPEIADSGGGLVADLAPGPGRDAVPVLVRCARRIRSFLLGRRLADR